MVDGGGGGDDDDNEGKQQQQQMTTIVCGRYSHVYVMCMRACVWFQAAFDEFQGNSMTLCMELELSLPRQNQVQP